MKKPSTIKKAAPKKVAAKKQSTAAQKGDVKISTAYAALKKSHAELQKSSSAIIDGFKSANKMLQEEKAAEIHNNLILQEIKAALEKKVDYLEKIVELQEADDDLLMLSTEIVKPEDARTRPEFESTHPGVEEIQFLNNTNEFLKSIQKYFYFSGDNHAKKVIEYNLEHLKLHNKSQAAELLKISTDALVLIQERSYGANDYFLNDIIRDNDNFLADE